MITIHPRRVPIFRKERPRPYNRTQHPHLRHMQGDTPVLLPALFPMFRMKSQLLNLSRNFCKEMNERFSEEKPKNQKLRFVNKTVKQGEMWVYRLQLSGVQAEDVKVIVKGDNLEVSSIDDNFKTKTITFPSGINSRAMKSYLTEDDFLVFEALFYSESENTVHDLKERRSTLPQNAGQTEAEDMDHDVLMINGVDDDSGDNENDDESEKEDNKDLLCFVSVPSPIEPLEDHPERTKNDRDSRNCDIIESTDIHGTKTNETDSKQAKAETITPYISKEMNSAVEKCQSSRVQDMFKIQCNLQKFPQENVQIRLKGQSLIIEAKIEEKDNGMEFMESFYRQYQLPSNTDIQNLKCVRKRDGHINISAPLRDTTSHPEMILPLLTED